MRQSRSRVYAATSLAVGASLWPSLLCAVIDATRTSYERAIANAWCGAGPVGAEFLGHCIACWGGAATLLAAALLVAIAPAPHNVRSN